MRSTPRVARQRRSRGLHRKHGSRGIPGPPLDRPVDVRQRVRDHGQLRPTPGELLDDDPVTSLVGQALEILVAERTESTIALQSELRRLRLVLFDRSFSRPEHDTVFESFRQTRLRAQRSQSGTNVKDVDRKRSGMARGVQVRVRTRQWCLPLRCETFSVIRML